MAERVEMSKYLGVIEKSSSSPSTAAIDMADQVHALACTRYKIS